MDFQRNIQGPKSLIGAGKFASEWEIIQTFFGPPTLVNPGIDITHQPVTTETVISYYGKRVQKIDQTFESILETLKSPDGWHFEVAELQKWDTLSRHYEKVVFDPHVMTPAPIESVPGYLTYRIEGKQFTLTRYHTAFHINTEFFTTPPGSLHFGALMAEATKTMIRTLKIIATAALVSAENEWIPILKNTTFPSVREALAPEVSMLLIGNKDPKAIYALDKYIRDLAREYDVNFDSAIFPFGTLNGLVYGTGFETDPQKIREDISYDRLIKGKESLERAIYGLKLYEDRIWNAQNLNARDISLLRRQIFTGEYFLVDSKDYMPSGVGETNCNEDTSVMVSDPQNDRLGRIDLKKCIENDVAWANNQPSPYFHNMIQNLQAHLNLTGIDVFNDQIDPWIIRSPHMISDGIKPSANGLSVIRVWGNQHAAYRSYKDDHNFGQIEAEKIRRELGANKISTLENGKKLTKRLSDLTEIMSVSVQAYFAAISANKENWVSQSYDTTKSIYLKKNLHGCVELPHIDLDPATTNAYIDPNTQQLVRDQASELKGKGAMYIMINGVAHYVWALYYQEDPTINISKTPTETMSNFVDSFGDTPTTAATWAELPITTEHNLATFAELPEKDFWDNIGPRIFEDTKYPDMLKGFIFAPFNYFGRVSPDGSAKAWQKSFRNGINLPDGSRSQETEFLSNEGLVLWAIRSILLQANQDYETDNITNNANNIVALIKALFNNNEELKSGVPLVRGIKAPRLVAPPSVPWGKGYIHSLRHLGDMFKNNNRGWSDEICKGAFEYTEAFDFYADRAISTSPECIALNPVYTANFMRSSSLEEDTKNNVFFNFVETATYPIWIRTPAIRTIKRKSSPTTTETHNLPVLYFSGLDPVSDLLNVPVARASMFSQDDIAHILSHMGVNGIHDHTNLTATDIQYGLPAITIPAATLSKSVAAALLTKLLNSRYLEENIKNLLKNNEGTNSTAAKLFRSYASDRSGLGSSYIKLKQRDVNNSFFSLFYHEIIPLLPRDPLRVNTGQLMSAANIFNGILNLAKSAMLSPNGHTNVITRQLLTALVKHNPKFGHNFSEDAQTLNQSKVSFETGRKFMFSTEPDFNFPGNTQASFSWINSGLVLSKQVWEYLQNLIENETDDLELMKYYNIPIRPTNPFNPVEPLASALVVNGHLNTQDYKNQFSQLKVAKAKLESDRSRYTSGLGIGNLHMFASARNHRPETISTRQNHFDLPSFSLDRGNNIISPGISNDPTGFFYVMEEFTDRDGRPLPEETRFVKEENLQKRLEYVHQNVKDMFTKVAICMMLLTPVTQSSELTWVERGLPPPDGVYLLFRVTCLNTDAAVWIESKKCLKVGHNFVGSSTGFDNMKDDLMVKFTGYFGGHVVKPKGFYIVDGFKAAGLVCGADLTFYNHPEQFDARQLSKQPYSLIAMRCGRRWGTEAANECNPISFFGRTYSEHIIQNIRDPLKREKTNTQQWPSFLFYDYVFKLTDAKPTIALSGLNSFELLRNNPLFYGMMWKTKWRKYNNRTGKYDITESGTSYLGNADPPLKAILNGANGIFSAQH